MVSCERILRIFPVLAALFLGSAALEPSPRQTAAAGAGDFRLHEPDRRWVAQALRGLSLRDKVAQLIQVRLMGRFYNRLSPEFEQVEDEIRRNHLGGLVLFAGNVYESAVLLNTLQQRSAIPLLVAADFETGASFRIADTTSFPWTMAIGATGSEEFAYRQGAVTAKEARALGVHWIFAPVVDVNNNPDNPVINIRSYGEDPRLVARLGAAFIRGAREGGVLTTAKHFPGHGDTSADSHIGLPVIRSDPARMEAVELVPFRSAVQAGVDAVMTAHIALPQLTGAADLPATLSGDILVGLLREKLQFRGLIVTDAMEMGGITTRYWSGLAAVRALQAGADVLLLPPDTDVVINEVVRAVERGDLSEERIDRSVERLLTAKTVLGLHRERSVGIERIAGLVATPESRSLAQEIADRSITLLRDEGTLLPLNPVKPGKIFSLVIASGLESSPAATFQAQMRRRFPDVVTESVDVRMPDDMLDDIAGQAAAADTVVCATLVRVVTGRGSIGLSEVQRRAIDRILASGKPVIWVALGNPYVLREYPQIPTYLCTFSYSEVSQIAAAKALSGEIDITGRMPISIPGYSEVGDGIRRPRLDMTLVRQVPPKHESAGEAFGELGRLLDAYVAERAFPGAALLVGHRGVLVVDTAAGRFDYSPESTRVTGDTIFDLASLSKAIGTTSAAMMLAETGKLLLDAEVQDYLPEFTGSGKDKVKVAHLLTHSSGLPSWLPLFEEVEGYGEFLTRVYSLPLEYEPGSKRAYSDFGMILLGEILSRAAASPLDQVLQERLFEPLGMESTFYNPAKSQWGRIPPTEDDPWRGRVVRGEVHDENAYAMGGVAGHAGLFSSAHDLAVFAQMMLNGGIYDHRRYFKGDTVAYFTRYHGSVERAQGLGWRKPSPAEWSGRVFSRSAFGHTGFTGTSIWIDPEKELFIILLTNRVHATRDNQRIEEARRAIAESVVRAVTAR